MAAPDTVQVRARCLCGANKFSWHVAATALPLDASVCHCDSCRHGTGTLGFTACTWPLPLPSEGELVNCSKSAFSSRADVYFCTSCGTLLFWHSDALPWLGLAVGALENPKSWCKMTLHMCLADTRDGGMSVWLDNVQNNRLKKHLTHDLSAEAGDDWMAKMPSQGDSGHDNLQASCRCGGVKFQVTRPTEQSESKAIDPREKVASRGIWWLRGEPPHKRYVAGLCVCDSCRLASGCEIMAWAFIPDCNLRGEGGEALPTPPVFGTIKHYPSSEEVDRYFCSQCGAVIFYVSKSRPRLPDVAVGLLWGKAGSRAEDWLSWATEIGPSNRADGLKRGFLTADMAEQMLAWRK